MNRNQKLIGLLMLSMSLLVSCGNEPEPKETVTTQNEVATQVAKEVEEVPKPTVQIDKSNPNWKENLELKTLYHFEAGKSYYWDMQTNKGEMSFKLYHESAPMHATSTIFLTELGFYDDV